MQSHILMAFEIFSRVYRIILISFLFSFLIFAQTFTKITDPDNPITTHIVPQYIGAAWVDYDGDGDMDLFVASKSLYKNEGNGKFSEVSTNIGEDVSGLGRGVTWADYDNDGDIDCYVAGNPCVLYRNEGTDTFTKIEHNDIDPENDIRGWGAAWGDYNNDGFVDLVIVHPRGFIGTPQLPSFLFDNYGGSYFVKNESYQFTQELAPYTVGTWADYDIDGDIDLFIGAGPAGTSPNAPDFLYVNTLKETNIADLDRIKSEPLGTDIQNGQAWNWNDIDNDGDFDGFLTNYNGVPDRLYLNEGGTFVSQTNNLTLSGGHLANNWGDVDNDGDLDVVITSENGNLFFLNNGDGTFEQVLESALLGDGASRGATFGDYDEDGDLDLYIVGGGEAFGLYRNDTDNENNWVMFNLEGTASNRSAIGARVRLKSVIKGAPVWQMREVQAQNSFNGHNSLQVHFGLGDAEQIDSLIVYWPSGSKTVMTNIGVNSYQSIKEDIPADFLRADFLIDNVFGLGSLDAEFRDNSVADPNNPITTWEWDFDNDGTIDATEANPVYTYADTGVYSVKLIVSTGTKSDTLTRENYIKVIQQPGTPIINSVTPSYTDTTLIERGSIEFMVEATDTSNLELSYEWYKNEELVFFQNFYNYRATAFEPRPRTDTVRVVVSNGYITTSHEWYVHVIEEATGVEEEMSLPEDYALFQNYPNPFNPSTTIKYTVPERGLVNIKVYNLLGEEIKTLVNQFQDAGFYQLTLDASELPSGIYFYRMESNRFSDSKKLILLK